MKTRNNFFDIKFFFACNMATDSILPGHWNGEINDVQGDIIN